MSETNRLALLLWVAASLAVCCRAEGPNATGKQDEVGVPPKSPPLQNFFQTSHQPLSFSYFDRAAPAPSATIPAASPKPAVLPRPDSINGDSLRVSHHDGLRHARDQGPETDDRRDGR
ncbi:uncharacterized protein [Bemisia tabaci]|uniref:uncharacterized protein n=1 Tax=Bemisia tabaci TaxID=7038 RepID=UPI003B27CD47